jgi:Domain of unknown function (DUF4375)
MRTSYWSLVEPLWLPLNLSWDEGPDEFPRQFRSVQPEIGHLYAAHWCQSEVCNGGLHQFFSNTTGLMAPESLDGFRAIGLADWAEIVDAAIKHFGDPYPRERSERQNVLPAPKWRGGPGLDLFDRLDERFFDAAVESEDAANAYVERAVAKKDG